MWQIAGTWLVDVFPPYSDDIEDCIKQWPIGDVYTGVKVSDAVAFRCLSRFNNLGKKKVKLDFGGDSVEEGLSLILCIQFSHKRWFHISTPREVWSYFWGEQLMLLKFFPLRFPDHVRLVLKPCFIHQWYKYLVLMTRWVSQTWTFHQMFSTPLGASCLNWCLNWHVLKALDTIGKYSK